MQTPEQKVLFPEWILRPSRAYILLPVWRERERESFFDKRMHNLLEIL